MDVRFVLVDVFAESPLSGNQLCVCPDLPAELDSAMMQALAREIGFSETTFVTDASSKRYANRIFTPVEELPFAGHPTLGTAFVLAAEGRIAPEAVQVTAAGEVPVRVDEPAGLATMHQLQPTFGPAVDDRASVAAGAGLDPSDLSRDVPIQSVSVGIPHLMVPVRDEATLRRASRNDEACRRATHEAQAESLYLFAIRRDGDVVARMFDKDVAIGEDPATGSAAGPLGAYLTTHGAAGMPGTLRIDQGGQTGRPSLLEVEVSHDGEWSIDVSGVVRIIGDGVFRV